MLKAGDVVNIKKDITNHFDYTPEMGKYQGKEVTVSRTYDGELYIKEDNGMWTWYADMIEE